MRPSGNELHKIKEAFDTRGNEFVRMVFKRWDAGKILETHLGLAARGLGLEITKMLDSQAKITEIRKFLDQIYNDESKKVDLKPYDDRIKVIDQALDTFLIYPE